MIQARKWMKVVVHRGLELNWVSSEEAGDDLCMRGQRQGWPMQSLLEQHQTVCPCLLDKIFIYLLDSCGNWRRFDWHFPQK